MNFFAAFLRKLEPSCEIGAYSAAIFRTVPYRKWRWRFLCHGIVRYSRLSRLQRCGTPILSVTLFGLYRWGALPLFLHKAVTYTKICCHYVQDWKFVGQQRVLSCILFYTDVSFLLKTVAEKTCSQLANDAWALAIAYVCVQWNI